MNNDKTGAAVKFPPPLAFLVWLLIAFGVHYFFPVSLWSWSGFNLTGFVFILSGLGFIFLAGYSFQRARTNITPWKPTTRIVSDGIFAWSRNPMYVSFCMIAIGIGLLFNSVWVMLSFIPSAFIVYYFVIRKEEAYLEKKFGNEYLEYKKRVRRWF